MPATKQATKQATKPVTPPCIDGTRAHRILIEGGMGHCVREGCTWGCEYGQTITEQQWNTKTKPEEFTS